MLGGVQVSTARSLYRTVTRTVTLYYRTVALLLRRSIASLLYRFVTLLLRYSIASLYYYSITLLLYIIEPTYSLLGFLLGLLFMLFFITALDNSLVY